MSLLNFGNWKHELVPDNKSSIDLEGCLKVHSKSGICGVVKSSRAWDIRGGAEVHTWFQSSTEGLLACTTLPTEIKTATLKLLHKSEWPTKASLRVYTLSARRARAKQLLSRLWKSTSKLKPQMTSPSRPGLSPKLQGLFFKNTTSPPKTSPPRLLELWPYKNWFYKLNSMPSVKFLSMTNGSSLIDQALILWSMLESTSVKRPRPTWFEQESGQSWVRGWGSQSLSYVRPELSGW